MNKEQLNKLYGAYQVTLSSIKEGLKPSMNMDRAILNSVFFELDDKLLTFLLPNKTNNSLYERELPFNNMFFPNELNFLGVDVHSFSIHKVYFDDSESDYWIKIVVFFYLNINYKDKVMAYYFNLSYDNGNYDNIDNSDIKFMNKFRILVCNILDFLNEPDVELVNTIRSQKNAKRRIKNNKQPLPNSTRVVVKGSLKKYFSDFQESDFKGITHRFWVRGHFRKLKSDKRIWIKPYIKGKGILINKDYLLKK